MIAMIAIGCIAAHAQEEDDRNPFSREMHKMDCLQRQLWVKAADAETGKSTLKAEDVSWACGEPEGDKGRTVIEGHRYETWVYRSHDPGWKENAWKITLKIEDGMVTSFDVHFAKDDKRK